MKKLEHELDKARRELWSRKVAMKSLKTEVKGLREVGSTIICERSLDEMGSSMLCSMCRHVSSLTFLCRLLMILGDAKRHAGEGRDCPERYNLGKFFA